MIKGINILSDTRILLKSNFFKSLFFLIYFLHKAGLVPTSWGVA